MNRNILKLCAVSLILALSIPIGSATVEWDILNTIKLDAPPRDVAVFPNGKYVFILSQDSNVQIYDLDGRLRNKFKVAEKALDFAIARNGRSVFVLTQNGNIHVYDLEGRLQHKIEVGKHIDQIKLGPRGTNLFATNRQSPTVEIIALDFIHNIPIQGSPFKGPENAPVVIVEFSDFE